MTRRIKRTKQFELTLNITDDQFIRPPRDSQRNWLLNQTMREFAANLQSLDDAASRFVAGGDPVELGDERHSPITDDDIMEDWQIPIMKAMAEYTAHPTHDLLEIGFGRGVSADFIQDIGVKSHTIVECDDLVIERYHQWREQYPSSAIRLIAGRWQDVTDQFSVYDAIFFHTYALNEEEYIETAIKDVTFAAHFFSTAAKYLKTGGVFSYLTTEIDSLSREHQRALFAHFSSFTLSKIAPLNLPSDVRDTWYADSMVIIQAVK